MSTKTIIGLIISIILVGAVAFVGVWGYTNFSKVQDGISGTGLYTQEDINKAYEDGYNTALTNEAEYNALIDGYRDTITGLNDIVSSLNSQISTLTNNNQTLTSQVTSLQSTITTLNTTITQLQSTGTANQATIDGLNLQISNLQVTISNLNTTIQQNGLTITNLNNQIGDMQAQFNYYATLLQGYNFENTVIVTFMFKGNTYNMQVVTKGTTVSLTNPVNPAFVGWTVDGVNVVNLATYTITEDVTFTAKILEYTVNFTVDGVPYGSPQTIEHGSFVQIPNIPTKALNSFAGWSIDGENAIDLTTYSITANVIFIALWEATFPYEELITKQITDLTTFHNEPFDITIGVKITFMFVLNDNFSYYEFVFKKTDNIMMFGAISINLIIGSACSFENELSTLFYILSDNRLISSAYVPPFTGDLKTSSMYIMAIESL